MTSTFLSEARKIKARSNLSLTTLWLDVYMDKLLIYTSSMIPSAFANVATEKSSASVYIVWLILY